MIYDCFMFFNELDLLEIRLNELCGTVDKFVIIESPETHQGGDKSLYFQAKWIRYKTFMKQIQAEIVWELEGKTPMERQCFQRDRLINILKDCKDDDWVIIGDPDEIPRSSAVKKVIEQDGHDPIFLAPTLYYYYLNGYVQANYGLGPVMLRWHDLKRTEPSIIRSVMSRIPRRIKDAGWHFSFLGGPEKIREKIQAFGYFQLNREEMTNLKRIQDVIDQGLDVVGKHEGQYVKYVPLDGTFPKYLLENREKFAHLIKEV